MKTPSGFRWRLLTVCMLLMVIVLAVIPALMSQPYVLRDVRYWITSGIILTVQSLLLYFVISPLVYNTWKKK